MELSMISVVTLLLLTLMGPQANAQKVASPPAPNPTPTPSPAPAPTSPYVNLTHLLTVAGPFSTFLDYLESTKVLDTFQNQANNTEEGVTIFVPRDSAFSSLKKPSLSNLTQDQLKQVMLFHALSHYYSLADFKNLSQSNPISTFAGSGEFGLNFTYVSGTVHLDSGWSKTKVISAVYSTDPVAVYEVDKVLLPEAIFGTDIPPTPAPVPVPVPAQAPQTSPAADAPSSEVPKGGHSPGSSPAKSSQKIVMPGVLIHLVLAVLGVMALPL